MEMEMANLELEIEMPEVEIDVEPQTEEPTMDTQEPTNKEPVVENDMDSTCLLYTSPSPRDGLLSRMPSSA